MKSKEIYLMGILKNVDSSILYLNDILEHGFEIKSFSLVEFDEFLRISSGSGMLFKPGPLAENVYYIHNSVQDNPDDSGYNYLNSLIRSLKLFKEGNACIICYYYYSYKENIPRISGREKYLINMESNRFTLEQSEIYGLKRFLNEIELPFKKDFIELAFENFETSYEVHNINLKFLSLMNAFEVLFHPSNRGELRYRISRNVAVLLGKDLDDSKDIFNDMKTLYDKRSDIVHRGKAEITNEDILILRDHLRESIKIIFKSGKKKDDILAILNLSGFGENPLKI